MCATSVFQQAHVQLVILVDMRFSVIVQFTTRPASSCNRCHSSQTLHLDMLSRTPYFKKAVVFSSSTHTRTSPSPPTHHTHHHHITTRSLKSFDNVGRASSSTGSPPRLSQVRSLGRGFCSKVDRDIENLVNSITHVNSLITTHLATLRESQLLPLCTRVLNFCNLTFRTQTLQCVGV